MKPLSSDRLRELIVYDAATGSMTWRLHRGHFAHAGEFCEANKKLADIALRAAERQQRMGHLAELHGSAPADREADERSLSAEFEIRCNGDYAASVCGPREEAWREACRYLTVYGQDGSVTIHEVTRRLVAVEDTGVPQDSEPTRSDE
jgi:hypothetical protein